MNAFIPCRDGIIRTKDLDTNKFISNADYSWTRTDGQTRFLPYTNSKMEYEETEWHDFPTIPGLVAFAFAWIAFCLICWALVVTSL